MIAARQLEFSLVHYVPNVVSGEFVNIGIILFDDAGGVHLRFTRDWRRVRALDPAADVETLEALEVDLNAQLTSGVLDRPTLVAKLQDYLTSGISLTPPSAVLAEDAATGLETLARMYLEHRRMGIRETSGRTAILAAMRTAFEDAGVWRHMRHRIAASQYTHRGDPLKIDCGYRPNGVIKLFHAVSLEADTDATKILAFSYPELRAGILRAEDAKTELTAIVEPDLDRSDDQIAFALTVLAKTEIAVQTTTELPAIAARAREDLRL